MFQQLSNHNLWIFFLWSIGESPATTDGFNMNCSSRKSVCRSQQKEDRILLSWIKDKHPQKIDEACRCPNLVKRQGDMYIFIIFHLWLRPWISSLKGEQNVIYKINFKKRCRSLLLGQHRRMDRLFPCWCRLCSSPWTKSPWTNQGPLGQPKSYGTQQFIA